MATITTETRELFVGDFVDNNGGIALDVIDPRQRPGIYSDIPLVELLDALSKIPGVTATYEEPKPTTWEILQGLGDYAVIRFGTEKTLWVRQPGGEYLSSGLGFLAPLTEVVANGMSTGITVEFEGIR